MSKKLIVVLLIAAMLTTVAVVTDPFHTNNNIEAATFRNGFTLTPEKSDLTGIAVDTAFILELDGTKEYRSAFIDNEKDPAVEQLSDRSYRITPADPLSEGKVYMIGVTDNDGIKTTWAFQSSSGFKTVASFPADKGTNVPVNTGIEIYFNQKNFENYKDRFEISPKAEGTFEVHKNVLVFVPKELAANTVYTVTVKKGINITGSDVSLEQDYTFSFSTAPENTANSDNSKGFLMFSSGLSEYSTIEDILVPTYYYFNKPEGTFSVETSVYAFKSISEFKKAYEDNQLIPYWAQGQLIPENMDIGGLSLVMTKSFELPAVQKTDADRYLDFGSDLAKGYYLIQAQFDGQVSQTFIQVTDIAVFVMNTDNGYFIWLKDLLTSENIKDAVLGFDTGKEYVSDENGSIITEIVNTDKSNMATVKTADDAILINLYNYDYSGYGYRGNVRGYWNLIQTDRTLYKPDDIVQFFGFLKARYESGKDLKEVTVEISRGGYYPYYSSYYDMSMIKGFFFPGMYEPMLKESVQVNSDFYEGNLKLPSLAEGSYSLVIKDGSTVLSSTYITVKNYAKPSYKLELSSDKKAIFLNDTVRFTLKSSFFEGTPVSDLDFRADVVSYFGSQNLSIADKTDINGQYVIVYGPAAADSQAQGMQYANITVSSAMPEIGEISVSDYLYVFINDIWANYESRISNGKGKLDIEVYYVDLVKMNKDLNDFKGAPAAGKKITGFVYRNEYVKQKTGEYYDYINKVTRETYTYNLVKTPVSSFDLYTDGSGKASFGFTAQSSTNYIYYTAEFTMTDKNGRTISNTAYFYDYSETNGYQGNYYDDSSRIEIAGTSQFRIGDTVEAKYIHLGKEINKGSYTYLLLQNGIRNVEFSDSSRFSFAFTEGMMPNTFVGGVYFTGTNFEYVEASAGYDYAERKIILTAELDKDSYRPGDDAVINITAKDINGMPVKANVYISVVDEALFALKDQYIDTLAELFSGVGNGIKYNYSTHQQGQDFYGPVYNERETRGGRADDGSKEESGANQATDAATAVRDEFLDTAMSGSVLLDENGKGTMNIKLPDNITSWRVTMQGISEDLKAGSDKVSLDVTMPLFINYSLSDVFLVGDKPYIGVSVYGTQLKEGDAIKLQIEDRDSVTVHDITAFERTYIPLDKFTEQGNYELILKASANSGLSDAVSHKYRVIGSFYEIDYAQTVKASQGIILPRGSNGLTTYSFTDSSTGKYADVLYSLLYSGGNRIEQKTVSKIAADLVRKYFNNEYIASDLNAKDFQRSDGGIAFLSYGESDIFTTVAVLPYIMDQIDISMVRTYLYSVLESDSVLPNSKTAALYGLSILKEPVLLQLKEYEKTVNLDIVDRIYTALAYTCFNETAEARRIYSQYVLDSVVKTEQNARLEFGDNLDDKLKNTALLAMLAVKIDISESDALFNYITKEYSNEYLTMIEKLEFLKTRLEKAAPVVAEVTYEYLGEQKTIDVGAYSSSVTVPSKMADGFRIISVKGEVDVVASYKVAQTISGSSSFVSIDRKYSNYTRPGMPVTKNDIIKVTLNVLINRESLDLGFEVTDYLPSGLRAIENLNSYNAYDKTGSLIYYYGSGEGQKVRFSVYGSREKDIAIEISYLARVVNPGEFIAEKPVIRGYTDKNIISTGTSQVLMIGQ